MWETWQVQYISDRNWCCTAPQIGKVLHKPNPTCQALPVDPCPIEIHWRFCHKIQTPASFHHNSMLQSAPGHTVTKLNTCTVSKRPLIGNGSFRQHLFFHLIGLFHQCLHKSVINVCRIRYHWYKLDVLLLMPPGAMSLKIQVVFLFFLRRESASGNSLFGIMWCVFLVTSKFNWQCFVAEFFLVHIFFLW